MHLERAELAYAYLEGAFLSAAHLEGANLRDAHLEGKTYGPSDADPAAALARIRTWAADCPPTLPPADVRNAVLDAATTLTDITLGSGRSGAVRVADVRWGGANLAVVDWTPLIEPEPMLGDERAAWEWKPRPSTPSEGKPTRLRPRGHTRGPDRALASPPPPRPPVP